MKITFTIENGKAVRLKNALCGLFPVPQITDPKDDDKMIPEFTEAQWAKECVRRYLIKQVSRWERRKAIDDAKKTILEENDLIT